MTTASSTGVDPVRTSLGTTKAELVTRHVEFRVTSEQQAHLARELEQPHPVLHREDFLELRLTVSVDLQNTLRICGSRPASSWISVALFGGWLAQIHMDHDAFGEFRRILEKPKLASWAPDRGFIELRHGSSIIRIEMAPRGLLQEAA